MNILYISGGITVSRKSIYKAGLSFSYNAIRALSADNKITLICLTDPEDNDLKKTSPLNDLCAKNIPIERKRYGALSHKLLRIKCFSINTLMEIHKARSLEMKKRIEDVCRSNRFDIAVYDSYTTAQYADCIRGFPKAFYLGDSLTLRAEEFLKSPTLGLFDRLEFLIQINKIKNTEKHDYAEFDKCIVAAEGDRSRLLRLNPLLDIAVLPFGVDVEYFKKISPEDNGIIIFTGVLWAEHNVDAVCYFYKEIFPIIKRKNKTVSLMLVGGASRREIKKIAASDPCVKLTDFVEDIRSYLNRATVFVAPIRIGSGMNSKVLEAMSMSKAIVTTEHGNRGINLKNNFEGVSCRSNYEFADAVSSLLVDKERRDFFGANARKRAEKDFSDKIYSEKWQEILKDVMHKYKNKP